MTDVWCRRIDCKKISKDPLGKDGLGLYGLCQSKEIDLLPRGCNDFEEEKDNEQTIKQ